jgi:hypothetical protein
MSQLKEVKKQLQKYLIFFALILVSLSSFSSRNVEAQTFELDRIAGKQMACKVGNNDRVILGYLNKKSRFIRLSGFLKLRRERLRNLGQMRRLSIFNKTWKRNQRDLTAQCREMNQPAPTPTPTPTPTPEPTPQPPKPMLVFTHGHTLASYDLESEILVNDLFEREDTGTDSLRDMTYDAATQTVFWADDSRNIIWKRALSSDQDVSILSDNTPRYLTLGAANTLYFTNASNDLYRMTRDGENLQQIIDAPLYGTPRNLIFLTDSNSLLIVTSTKIWEIDIDAQTQTDRFTFSTSITRAARNPANGDLFGLIASFSGNDPRLLRVSADWSGDEELANDGLGGVYRDIRIDSNANELVLSGLNGLTRATIAGSFIEKLDLDDVTFWPELFELDLAENTILTFGSYPESLYVVDRVSEETTLVTEARSNIETVKKGNNANEVYFRDVGRSGIYRYQVGGGTPERLVRITTGSSSSASITSSENRLYWNESSSLAHSRIDGTDRNVITIAAQDAGARENSVKFNFDQETQSLYWSRVTEAGSPPGPDKDVLKLEIPESMVLNGLNITPEVIASGEFAFREILKLPSSNALLLSSSSKIERLDLDSLVLSPIVEGINSVGDMAINSDETVLYYVEKNTRSIKAIELATLESSTILTMPDGSTLQGLTFLEFESE